GRCRSVRCFVAHAVASLYNPPMRNKTQFLAPLTLALLATLPAAAATAEVKGKVADEDGKPIPGAVITLTNQVNTTLTYHDTSDKRGNYWLPGVLYNEAATIWNLKIEAKDFTAVKATIDIRTSNKTLLDHFDRTLKNRGGQLEVKLAAFGTTTADFVL